MTILDLVTPKVNYAELLPELISKRNRYNDLSVAALNEINGSFSQFFKRWLLEYSDLRDLFSKMRDTADNINVNISKIYNNVTAVHFKEVNDSELNRLAKEATSMLEPLLTKVSESKCLIEKVVATLSEGDTLAAIADLASIKHELKKTQLKTIGILRDYVAQAVDKLVNQDDRKTEIYCKVEN